MSLLDVFMMGLMPDNVQLLWIDVPSSIEQPK